jgi:hypothetical protein
MPEQDPPLPQWEATNEVAERAMSVEDDEDGVLTEEAPTGQLEPVEYEHSAGIGEEVEDVTTPSPGVKGERRPYGGVYDVEADGWG